MTTADAIIIRDLFSTTRQIDRPIEKVIDYYATEARRLLAEVEEYAVTANVERNFQRFLDAFGDAVSSGRVSETSIWVSGFYGSGKSSFTKYLGFSLDPTRLVEGRPFLDLLAERIDAIDVRQQLKTLAVRHPVAVVMLDLGAEQLASSSSTSISTVLYWKVLQWARYSKEEKVAHLELRLDRDGRLDEFRRAHTEMFGTEWDAIHNDPLTAVTHADRLAPRFYPQEFPDSGVFIKMRFSLANDLRDQVAEMLDLVRRKSGCENVLFLIDEAGQYVAPRGELILNLDGLARNVKELGCGRAWIVATGQQTLTEIVEKAAYNSQELHKLRDRFPIAIELDARDIREITQRRLLGKSAEGETVLANLYRRHGQSLAANTRLAGTPIFKSDPDEQTFVQLYPFLPQHFDLLMELVRVLARRTGGIGLRSAIRVIQDVLVDASRALPPSTPLLADGPLGRLATVDLFFDTLRADIGKEHPYILASVDRVATAFADNELALRAAKAIGALQLIETFPRTVEHIAALLYRQVGDAPHLDAVRDIVRRLLDMRELGLVDDPQAGGLLFLSDSVNKITVERTTYNPTSAEMAQLRSRILHSLFETPPSAKLDGEKTVRAGVQIGRAPIVGDDEEIQVRLEITSGGAWDERRTALLAETIGNAVWRTSIAWLIRPDEAVDDALVDVLRSRRVLQKYPEAEADRDVAQYLRVERRAAENYEDRTRTLYRNALMEGTLIFHGKPTPAGSVGATPDAAARTVLQGAAAEIYPLYHLVNLRPATDLAARFLEVERLDRMPRERDPLGFAAAGRAVIDTRHGALAEALRFVRQRLDDAGTGRLQGNTLQDLFATAPYGWSKDATRYVFAALLRAGEIVLHTATGPVQTAGPDAIEAMRNTINFGRIGVGLRDSRPSLEALDRAARRLEEMLGASVMPLEEAISAAARDALPKLLEPMTSLPVQLQLLGLAGTQRAQALLDTADDLRGQDGAAAIGILGEPGCTFPSDLTWAKQAQASLDNGAARDIEQARVTIREAAEIEQFFPEVHLADETEQEILRNVGASHEFYARLADLRGIAPRLGERAATLYRDRLVAYDADLLGARNDLEALPDWERLTDEDRAALAGRLASAVPSAPPASQELSVLKLLLVRHSSIAGLLDQLKQEVARRAPIEPTAVRETAEAQPVEIDLSAQVAGVVIDDTAALRAWLDALEGLIGNALAAGAPVRVTVRR